jgi:hypothetical protein
MQTNVLPALREFQAEFGCTIREAAERGSIVKLTETSRYGKERPIGWSPGLADSYQYTNAAEAMRKQQELKAEAEARISPDERLRERVWASMSPEQRREARNNPMVWECDNGVMDWAILSPYAIAIGVNHET